MRDRRGGDRRAEAKRRVPAVRRHHPPGPFGLSLCIVSSKSSPLKNFYHQQRGSTTNSGLGRPLLHGGGAAGSPRYHRLTWRWSGSGAGGSRLSAAGSPIFSTPGVPPSALGRFLIAAVPGHVRRARCMVKVRRRESPQWWASLPVFAVWRLAPVAWRFGPTHACQGVGCRYCDVSVPGDGRGSCGRALPLGRGMRPALDTLLNACRMRLGETSPALGRCSRPHGQTRTILGANGHIYRGRTARSRSWLRRWVACRHLRYLRAISALMRVEIAISWRRRPRGHPRPWPAT